MAGRVAASADTPGCTTQALIRRKVRVVDKDALLQIKIPLPLPLSWGRTVQPYFPPELRRRHQVAERDENVDSNGARPACQYLEQDRVLATDWVSLRRDYQVCHPSTSSAVSGAFADGVSLCCGDFCCSTSSKTH